jgi:hypothetical protein
VTEFVYRFRSLDVAHVFLSFRLEGQVARTDEVASVLAACAKDDLSAIDISDDELAKSHARYMIGGRENVPNERVFRFRECLSHHISRRVGLTLDFQDSRSVRARCESSSSG